MEIKPYNSVWIFANYTHFNLIYTNETDFKN